MAYACWRTEDLDSVLNLEALVGKEELFFATHLPIEGLVVKKGSSLVSGSKSIGQGALFETLCSPRDHMFCVVEGVAGCGKSHLIRWLYIQWKRKGPNSDIVLLLPRSGRNPGKMVQELKRSLEGYGFAALASILAISTDLNKVGQRIDLINKLGIYLNPDATTLTYSHADWCKARKLSALMEAAAVRDRWRAPDRIISDHTTTDLPKFTRDEVWELAQLALTSTLPPVTRVAMEKIRREQEKETYEDADRLAESLNARVRPALRSALGLSDTAISQVFVDLREQLYKEGRRLVILQEDITAAQGIDDTLLDMFVSPGGIGSVPGCPLVAVCGITPQYERQYFNQTYGTRTTVHLDMSESGAGSGVIATSQLRSRFVARYLNGVRWSPEELRIRWAGEGSPPNACDNCLERPQCHPVFGTADGYGLYPFTAEAVENAFEYLYDPAGQDVTQTPRNMLLGLLQPSLKLKKQLEDSRFPGPEVRTDRLKASVFQLRPQVSNLLRSRFSSEYSRMENLIGLWGDRGETVGTIKDGVSAFSNVPKGVYERFGLPWPGEELVRGPEGTRKVDVEEHGEKEPETDPKEREYKLRSQELNAWKPGELIASANTWEGWVWGILRAINWADYDLPEWAGKWLTKERVKLGKGPATYLVIPHDSWVTEGLDSLIEFEFTPHSDFGRFGSAYLNFVAKVREMGITYVRTRLRNLVDVDGQPWSPMRAAIECLLIYGWVNGFLTPVDSLERHWQFVLDYPAKAAGTSGREEGWQELAGGDLALLQRAHALLESWVALRQGGGPTCLDNGATALSVLHQFRESLELGPLPESNRLGNQGDLLSLEQALQFATRRWPGLSDREYERLSSLIKFVLESLSSNSLKEACLKVDEALSQGFHLANVAAHEYKTFSELYAAFRLEKWWATNEFEEGLDKWTDSGEDPPTLRLTQCIKAPAGQYDAVGRLLRAGDEALYAIQEKLEDVLRQGGGDLTGLAQSIRMSGEKLLKEVKAMEVAAP
jgi:hypothetical protein